MRYTERRLRSPVFNAQAESGQNYPALANVWTLRVVHDLVPGAAPPARSTSTPSANTPNSVIFNNGAEEMVGWVAPLGASPAELAPPAGAAESEAAPEAEAAPESEGAAESESPDAGSSTGNEEVAAEESE